MIAISNIFGCLRVAFGNVKMFGRSSGIQAVFGYLPEDFVLSNKPAQYLAKMHSFLTVLAN